MIVSKFSTRFLFSICIGWFILCIGCGRSPKSDVRQLGHWENADSVYTGTVENGRCEGEGELLLKKKHLFYSGAFHKGFFHGIGTLQDSAQTKWQGEWRHGKLNYGRMSTAEGTYEGSFNDKLQPQGYGIFWGKDSLTFYEGNWENGLRQGFGAGTKNQVEVHCGWWKSDAFWGEKMKYSSSRIYGIDISRYQHILRGNAKTKKKRKSSYTSIKWKDLRITSLGKTHDKNATGRVDFPVSFCYIKSTQGTTIRNQYYSQDVRAARQTGIPVGAYHFMSPISGEKQAKWFLKNTTVGARDLPPVLDVEIPEQKIRKWGGDAVLLREMQVWLDAVENATGKRPILYVSQTFITRHLLNASTRLRSYPVWVARYGEYRPYVRLLYWQLSDQGRVQGIQGDVDIDVFNGTPEQFQTYLNQIR